ncbi:RagB/SusD family nutrient uptake outer membrane protein [Alkalitalea saponilacus]|uniref:SusD family protein n=1 Tax=Alkalitalea saponilacus TaxID=889453 RepID=A0A1T5A1Z5_9BACT|nr:RagB/SusD family nutrient uptake outer membrane protein [Alkalitalea saponilacus]ASB48901.1 RagB/SusD family nutrient uptake outer membrane protein [Alkalitalea saponilacus]SKB28998.1 SusD family protein [Alkalitalea saponilacus]
MKKILYLLIAGVLFMGCEDFLDTDPLTQKTSANFPQTRADAEQLMAGIYTVMSSLQHRADESPFIIWEIASDDKLGGGGLNDVKAQAYETFQFSDNEMTLWPWQTLYQGIHRANFALEVLDNVPDQELSPDMKDQFKGEAKFLRAWYYFQLNTIFNEVPLKLTTEAINLPASSADEIYGQIASDLKAAIELMPDVPYTSTQQGRVTKWAAQALMARCFLFYTGFYGQQSITLPEGGSVTRANVISWLEDLTTNSGHHLVDDFHELWPYTNSLTIGDYDYIQDYMAETGKTLLYAADNGARNPEAIFVQQFNNFAAWNIDRGYSNTYQLFFALRGLQNVARTFPFAGGWGQGNSVPESLVNQWLEDEPNDPRLWASVIDIEAELMQRYVLSDPEDPNSELVYAGYQRGQWDFVMESNYWGKKIHGVAVRTEQGQYFSSYSHLMYGTQNNSQLGHTDDLMFIRYADVLLMLSELKEDATYMNEVRARVGLDPVTYTLENLQKERRYELAFEGLRWNDMRRWGAEYTTTHLEHQEGVAILDYGQWTTHTALHPSGYTARYNATQGFFPIPFSQIRLSEGLLEQNAGYTEGGLGLYQGY